MKSFGWHIARWVAHCTNKQKVDIKQMIVAVYIKSYRKEFILIGK